MLARLEKDPIITVLVALQKQIFAGTLGTPISRLAILWPQATVRVRQLAATFSSGQACLARPALRCLPTLLLGGSSRPSALCGTRAVCVPDGVPGRDLHLPLRLCLQGGSPRLGSQGLYLQTLSLNQSGEHAL